MPLDNDDLDMLLFPVWNAKAENLLQKIIEPDQRIMYAENFLNLSKTNP